MTLRHDAGRLEIDDGDFMRSIARMQDRGPIALRVQGHIDGKIADLDLLACRSQRPLVRQQHGAVGLQSRQGAEQHSRVGRGLLGRGGPGDSRCGQSREDTQIGKYRDARSDP